MAADTLSSLEGLQDGTLSPHRITKLHNDFEGSPVHRMAQNAVCKIAVDDIALDRQICLPTATSPSAMCSMTGALPTRKAAADAGCSLG